MNSVANALTSRQLANALSCPPPYVTADIDNRYRPIKLL
jgi:hypothetical protein